MRTNSYEILKINKAANHCSVPECDDAFLVVSKPVTLTILDAAGTPPPAGALVTVFDNETETTFNSTTNQSGQATFTLPFGSYRFRANFVSDGNISNGWQQVDFWSGGQNHCTLPGCESVQITVPKPVTVTVLDGDGLPAAGMEVATYDAVGEVSHDLTDAAGTVRLFLPEGAYRFSASYMGVTHWSGAEGHCATPVCETAQINIPKPVKVTVQYENGDPYPEINVRTFTGETPTGYTAVTDAVGEALIYAPAGAYRFAADIKGTLFYSDDTNHCAIPGCETVEIEIPGGFEYREVTIDYTYDALYRLTAAEYSTGEVFEYTYDATGNRLTQTVTIDEVPVATTYTYDDANRLSQVGAQAYTWDNNGNLLSDGEKQYYYDPANRLTALVEGEDTTYYLYNGQGDSIAQIEDDVQTSYILDLNAGLTQVLNDGTSAYVYGLDLVSQQTGIYEEYPLRDALGSVRQMTDQSSAITGSRNYEPYGSLLSSSGEESMAYGFAGEWMDVSGMQYLRARFYNPTVGRFVSRDKWEGISYQPLSFNRWLYVQGNPTNLRDPSGLFPCPDRLWDDSCSIDDYYSAVFNPILNTVAGSQTYSGQHIITGTKNVNVEGAIIREYMTYASYYGKVMNTIADFGLNSIPGINYGYGFTRLLFNEDPLNGQPISPEERALSAAFLAAGGIYDYKGLFCKSVFSGSAYDAFDEAIKKGILNPKYRDSAKGFIGDTALVRLHEDVIVIQRTSSGASLTPWFSTTEYVKTGNARRFLALPSYNSDQQITYYTIPKNTEVIVGKVAPQVDVPTFGDYAVGGGFQIYLPELSKAIKLP